MDLQDFGSEALYFDEPAPPHVRALMMVASEAYGTGDAERPLLEALGCAPKNLTILVGAYRFYFYQHRYADAIEISMQVMAVLAPRIDFPESWIDLDERALGRGVMRSFSLVRFYLLALKAAAYINLRLSRFDVARAMLQKIVLLDAADRLGARGLLALVSAPGTELMASHPARLMEAAS